MKALVYHGPNAKAWEEVPKPEILVDTDAVIRVDCTTICGTDLHILKGDLPAVTEGRILGHEAVGTVDTVGSGGQEPPRRRSGPRVVCDSLRCLPLLPGEPLRSMPGRRGLDPGQHHRRDPGRVRSGSIRRQLDLSRPRSEWATNPC